MKQLLFYIIILFLIFTQNTFSETFKRYENYPVFSLFLYQDSVIFNYWQEDVIEESPYKLSSYKDFTVLSTEEKDFVYLESEHFLFLLPAIGDFIYGTRVEGIIGGMTQQHHLPFSKISATSYLQEVINNTVVEYKPTNLLNLDLRSCWVEGAEGNGEDEQLYLIIDYGKTNSIIIYNGFIYPKKLDLFYHNTRVKEIDIELESGNHFQFVLEDKPDAQILSFPEFSREFTITIKSVYPGEKYTDLAISGIFIDWFGYKYY